MAWCGLTCSYLAEKRRWTTEDGLGSVGAFGAGGVADTGAGAAAVEGAAKADMVATNVDVAGCTTEQNGCVPNTPCVATSKQNLSQQQRELME